VGGTFDGDYNDDIVHIAGFSYDLQQLLNVDAITFRLFGKQHLKKLFLLLLGLKYAPR
jgi:hypothetical protein